MFPDWSKKVLKRYRIRYFRVLPLIWGLSNTTEYVNPAPLGGATVGGPAAQTLQNTVFPLIWGQLL